MHALYVVDQLFLVCKAVEFSCSCLTQFAQMWIGFAEFLWLCIGALLALIPRSAFAVAFLDESPSHDTSMFLSLSKSKSRSPIRLRSDSRAKLLRIAWFNVDLNTKPTLTYADLHGPKVFPKSQHKFSQATSSVQARSVSPATVSHPIRSLEIFDIHHSCTICCDLSKTYVRLGERVHAYQNLRKGHENRYKAYRKTVFSYKPPCVFST